MATTDKQNAPSIDSIVTGNAAKLGRRAPREPSRALAGQSLSPYAPLKGLPMGWASNVYDDGATYEGTEFAGQPHGKGVLHAGRAGGGAVSDMELGDRYEGEFHLGFADGLGMLAKQDGKIYRGQFVLGKRHGCGLQTDLGPYYAAIAKGKSPEDAWTATKDAVAGAATPGTFDRGFLVSGPSDSRGFCSEAEIDGTVEEVDGIVARARMFQFKPDGAVATAASQDASGAPAPLMQDPLHYPHATKFAAPGPLGQCFALPDDPATRAALDDAAHNHELVWSEFNLPYNIEPGSDMDLARAHAAEVASERLAAARPTVVLNDAQAALDAARARAEGELAAKQRGAAAAALAARRAVAIDDDDLVADVGGGNTRTSGVRPGAQRPRDTGFGSMSMAVAGALEAFGRALRGGTD